jgi:hypothetical protein
VDRLAIPKVFAAAALIGLLAGIGTMNVGYGLAAFVITLLGFGGYELISGRKQRGTSWNAAGNKIGSP